MYRERLAQYTPGGALRELLRLHKQVPGEGNKIMALVFGPVGGRLVGLATSRVGVGWAVGVGAVVCLPFWGPALAVSISVAGAIGY